MFRDEYHKANDSIPINTELLEKIKNIKPKKRKNFYPHATVAASILIISAAVVAYPKFKITEEPIQTPTFEIEYVEPETKVDLPEVIEENESENNTNEEVENKNTEKEYRSENSKKADKVKTVEKSDKNYSYEVEKHDKQSVKNTVSETPKPYPEEMKKQQIALTQGIKPEENNAQVSRSVTPEPEKQGEVLGVTSDEVQKEELVTEVWTNEDYFEYLGREVTPDIPADLKDVTPKEKNMTVYADTKEPYFDSWTLKYESEDKERNVSLRLSKTSEQNSVDSESASKENEQMQTDIVKDGVKCNVKTSGLTEEEFAGVLNSI